LLHASHSTTRASHLLKRVGFFSMNDGFSITLISVSSASQLLAQSSCRYLCNNNLRQFESRITITDVARLATAFLFLKWTTRCIYTYCTWFCETYHHELIGKVSWSFNGNHKFAHVFLNFVFCFWDENCRFCKKSELRLIVQYVHTRKNETKKFTKRNSFCYKTIQSFLNSVISAFKRLFRVQVSSSQTYVSMQFFLQDKDHIIPFIAENRYSSALCYARYRECYAGARFRY